MKNFWLIYALFSPLLSIANHSPTIANENFELPLDAIPYFSQSEISHNALIRAVPFYDRFGYEFKTKNGTWSLFDYDRQAIYMRLDNKTIASYDNIVDDPFLALRTKITGIASHMNANASWENLAHFQALAPVSYDTILPSCNDLYQDVPNFDDFPIPSIIKVINSTSCFDHAIPYFDLKTETPCDKIWWQISPDANFAFVIPNFEEIQDFEATIQLDRLTSTFFNLDTDYFFRVKSQQNGVWSEWSSLFHFTVKRPEIVKNVSFQKIDDNAYEISWSPSRSGTRYHIFASNSRDFIPTIYYDRHINAINPDRTEFLLNDNLQTITTTSNIQIDGSYNYYRILAEFEGCYSIPSQLIYVYDTTPMPPRDILQLLPSGNAQRVTFPTAYPSLAVKTAFLSDELLTMLSPNTALVDVMVDEITPLDGYTPLPHVDAKVWEFVSPYLLPENHPIKAKLDRIFSERATLNMGSMLRAGFLSPRPRPYSNTVVSRHPDLKEYIIKGFLDEQRNVVDWQKLMRRIQGAELIQKAIKHHQYGSIFKVPQKWIYPLPLEPAPPRLYYRKNFILIAEDMHIMNKTDNYKAWKSSKMTKEKLNAIFNIIEKLGLSDSVVAFNIPFIEGEDTMAFIDTEVWHRWPIDYKRLTPYLSSSMQSYWKKLIKNKHPKK